MCHRIFGRALLVLIATGLHVYHISIIHVHPETLKLGERVSAPSNGAHLLLVLPSVSGIKSEEAQLTATSTLCFSYYRREKSRRTRKAKSSTSKASAVRAR